MLSQHAGLKLYKHSILFNLMALWCGEHQRFAGNLCQQPQKVHYNTIPTYLHRVITVYNSIDSSGWLWEDVIDDI